MTSSSMAAWNDTMPMYRIAAVFSVVYLGLLLIACTRDRNKVPRVGRVLIGLSLLAAAPAVYFVLCHAWPVLLSRSILMALDRVRVPFLLVLYPCLALLYLVALVWFAPNKYSLPTYSYPHSHLWLMYVTALLAFISWLVFSGLNFAD
jgi:hypothetical protein